MSDLLTTTTLCGFPKSFLSSLKVLFDILDDRSTGYVKLADIEERWRDDGSIDSLPPGVTAALRKVAPPDGKLTFERFVAGLKIALLHDRNDSSETEPNLNDVNNKVGRKEPIPPTYRAKPVSAVNLGGHKSGTSNDVPLMTKQRAFSMPQLDGKVPYPHNAHGGNAGTKRGESTDQQYCHSANQRQQATNRPPGNNNRNGADPDMLYRWQQQQLLKAGDQEKRSSDRQSDFRKPGDGKSSTSSNSALEQYSGVAGDVAQAKGRGSTAAPPGGTRMVKRRDSRRHTLANGVDFNMIKRMKQLERERDVLLQGLEMVERARNWYQQQLHAVQEKQRSASAHNDQSLEAHQERISLQMARIFEVNQQLKALVESSEKGLPFHMNLAVSGPGRPHLNHTTELREKDTTIGRLKSQNRMLTQEVSATSEKVTQLEQEKRQLIRELFEARAHKHKSENKTHSYDDTTFI